MQRATYLPHREGSAVQLPSGEACTRQPRLRHARLRWPIARCIRYATCTAENSYLRFLPDIYGRDAAIRRGLLSPAR
ncbi:hypothetical protein [Hymenobacter nivis]|uniref:Uncharacterized protein n=1 Tax=Hymenobacter nivis TaxID=1850093 RepID=A0A2Z3GHL6_9BACT|nr:hypothetical protein [Hymenobacter nivis]AWM31721.1 hypothetical protein DDQ68_02310 [Hymenobacter nivis]